MIVGPAPDKLRKGRTYLVMRSSIDLGSRMKVGRTTRLKSAPGRSCEMICERTVFPMLMGGHRGGSGWSFPNADGGHDTISLLGLDNLVLPTTGGFVHG